jgi:hypothetical protein
VSEVGPAFAIRTVIPAVREAVTDRDSFEKLPDDLHNAQSGLSVNTTTERGARAAKGANRREAEAEGDDRLAFLTEASRKLAASLDY